MYGEERSSGGAAVVGHVPVSSGVFVGHTSSGLVGVGVREHGWLPVWCGVMQFMRTCGPREQEAKVKKRVPNPTAPENGAFAHNASIETKLFKDCPQFVSHLTTTRYDDGTPRQPGWVSIQTRGAAWIVTVKDPDAGAKLNATGNTLDDALALAELLLSSEEAPWEVDPFLQGQQKKKKKAS